MSFAASRVPWRPLLRSLAATAGRTALQRALPLYLGLLITANVLFEGNGVRPADVVERLNASLGDRALAYGAWTIVSVPAIRALLTAPSSFFLRTLPIPRWQLHTLLLAALLLAELPWAYLWIRGGGLLLGLTHVTAALAVASLTLTGLARRRELTLAVLLALALASSPHWSVVLAVSAPAAALSLRAVWLRAPEPRSSSARSWIGGSPGRALASSYALLLWRRAAAQLARSLALTLLALLVSFFAVRNNPPDSAAGLLVWALATVTPALLLAGASLAGPLLHVEAQLSWLLAVCGTSRTAQRTARWAPLAASLAVLATLHAVALGAALALPPGLRASLWLSELGGALLLAALVLGIARWAVRGDGNDSGRFVIGVGVALIAAIGAVVWLGMFGLGLWVAAAAISWLEPWAAERTAGALRTWLER